MSATPDQQWAAFEKSILEIATAFAELRKDRFDFTPPKNVACDLKALDKALTVALQVIGPLQLEHQEGQDVIATPFNWPVVQALDFARWQMNAQRGITEQDPAAYPTDLIKGLQQLRDAARFALELEKPGPGNSARRSPSSARMACLAKNFVSQFRSRFGRMPPITKYGREIKLLERMLEVAGEPSINKGKDCAQLLRTAIERDTAGRALLQSVRTAKGAKRAK